jgi:hypothetical protein
MKPGMETAHLTYVANDWKRRRLQEAGFSSPKCSDGGAQRRRFQPHPHDGYKDLATLEANEGKTEALPRPWSAMTRNRGRPRHA